MSAARHVPFLLALLPCIVWAQNDPPVVSTSYKAMGELVQSLDDTGITFQLAFEEHYDVQTKNAEFTVWQFGKKLTFLESGKTNQTLLYENDTKCSVVTKKDWIKVDAPPSMLGYSDTDGRIRFSLRHLLDLDPKYLVEDKKGIPAQYRNLSAISWMYEMKENPDSKGTTINVYAYWSDKKWNTTSGNVSVPLGYKLTNITNVPGQKPITSAQYVNVFGFMKGVVDQKAFRAREGIYCKDRIHPYQLPTFPRVSSLSLRSEYVLPDYQDINTMDAYYDITNGLLRVDLDRLDDSSPVIEEGRATSRRYTSEITSKSLGVTFRINAFRGQMNCTVTPIDQYDFDPQEVINPKLELKKWSIHSIIGRNTTTYVFMGNTYKRNIPCKLFQGIRKDWPDEESKVTSLWEWCFSYMIESNDEYIVLRDGDAGLISASINILESTKANFPVGFRMVHHFYDVVNENSRDMSFAKFDLHRCFRRSEKQFLQFTVKSNINQDNIHIFDNATSDIDFLVSWKDAIALVAKTALQTRRVANVQSFIFNNKLYVEFYLLGLHKDLPDSVKKNEPSLVDAVNNLEKAVNDGKLNITYSTPTKPIPLSAAKNTLVKGFEKFTDFDPLTTTTTEGTTSTRGTLPPFSIVTDSSSSGGGSTASGGSTSSGGSTASGGSPGTLSTKPTGSGPQSTVTSGTGTAPTPSDKPIDKKDVNPVYDGHKPGVVAGVSIVMLLLGMTAGAGGTFYSFKGLPSFLRFR